MRVGDRVVVYHISGCGQCDECRRGYQISCTSPRRQAYGWQRDGGHADQLLARERDLLPLPDSLTFLDGACVACGFATAYEALCRVALAGGEQVLVTGLGPVGLAAGMLASAMGSPWVVGTDPSPERRALARELGAVDVAVASPTTSSATSSATAPRWPSTAPARAPPSSPRCGTPAGTGAARSSGRAGR